MKMFRMPLLFDEALADIANMETYDPDVEKVSGIRIFERGTDSPEGYAWVLGEGGLDASAEHIPRNIILIGHTETLPAGWKGNIVVCDAGVSAGEVLNRVQNVFDRYEHWSDGVLDAIIEGESLQEILDRCATVLQNPIAIFDNQHTLLMSAGDVSGAKRGALWDYVLTKGYSPKEDDEEQRYLQKMIDTSDEPFHYRSKDRYSHNDRLIVALRRGRSILGTLAMTDMNAPLDEAESERMSMVRHLLEKAFLRSDDYAASLSEAPWYLTQLIEGTPVDPDTLRREMASRAMRTDQPFFLWVCVPAPDNPMENPSSDAGLTGFARCFDTDMCFPYRGGVVVMERRVERAGESTYIEAADEFLQASGFNGASSLVFRRIEDIRHAYRQCLLVLSSTVFEEHHVAGFGGYLNDRVLDVIRVSPYRDDLLYPGIDRLKELHGSHERDLLICLSRYLHLGCNVSATAASLCVHRHTVVYRLGIASKAMGVDLQALTEDESVHLYLSCRVLLGA